MAAEDCPIDSAKLSSISKCLLLEEPDFMAEDSFLRVANFSIEKYSSLGEDGGDGGAIQGGGGGPGNFVYLFIVEPFYVFVDQPAQGRCWHVTQGTRYNTSPKTSKSM